MTPDSHDRPEIAFGGATAAQSANVPSCSLTILRSVDGAVATKTFSRDATGKLRKEGYGKAKFFAVEERQVANIAELGAAIEGLQDERTAFVVRGELVETANATYTRRLLYPGGRTGEPATFRAANRRWIMLDFDGVPCPAWIDPIADPAGAIEYLIGLLPQAFHEASCWWQWSSSQGMDGGITLSACTSVGLAGPHNC
jgi:hypothetical protein